MSKVNVMLSGKKVTIDTDRPKVASALAALIEACAERHFPIGSVYTHRNGDDYLLCRIPCGGGYRAYLFNIRTGVTRNHTKVVMVQEPNVGRGYVTDLPDKKDQFYDPENPGQFIER